VPVEGVSAHWGESVFVDTQAGLKKTLAALARKKCFAYDSEFMGEQTYLPQLCLIQVATDDGLWLIDPMAGLDLTGFWELLAEPSVLKVSHAGQPDYEPLIRHLGRPPAGTLDTQVAAGFLGMGYPLGLDKIVLATTGVVLQKAPKFSQWDRRPLTSVQLRYAGDDVRYLIHAGRVLQEKLQEAGRYEWAISECEAQLNTGPVNADPLKPMAKIRSAVKMPQPSYSTLMKLLVWRDAQARRRNLPVRMIAPDDALVSIAHDMPTEPGQLQGVAGLARRLKDEHAQEILDVVREGRKNPEPLDMGLKAAHERSRDRDTIDQWCKALREECTRLGIESTLAFSRRDVTRLYNARVRRLPDYENRLSVGWRAACFGQRLEGLIASALLKKAQSRVESPEPGLFPESDAEPDADSTVND
jgi:ribonuclease D